MSPPAMVVSIHQQIAARPQAELRCGPQAPGMLLRGEQPAVRSGVGRSLMRQVLQQLTYERLLPEQPTSRTAVAALPSAVTTAIQRERRARRACRASPQCGDPLHGGAFQRWRDMPRAMHIMRSRHAACGGVDPATACVPGSLLHRALVDQAALGGPTGVGTVIAGGPAEYMKIDANRARHADFDQLFPMPARVVGDVSARRPAAWLPVRKPFAAASYRCCVAAGKLHEVAGVYDRPATSPRRRAEHLHTQPA